MDASGRVACEADISGILDVYITAGYGHVWNVRAAQVLRQRMGVIGAMVGTLAEYRQQNVVRGLPLVLTPEEVSLALGMGWIRLWDGGAGVLQGSDFSKSSGTSAPRDGQEGGDHDPSLATLLNRTTEKASMDKTDGMPAGEAKEMKDVRLGHTDSIESVVATADAGAASSNGGAPDVSPFLSNGGNQGKPADPSEARKAAEVEAALQLAGAPTGTAGGGRITLPLIGGVRMEPITWNHPASANEKLRCAVVADLHSRRYRVSDGTKFGVDLLAYPGDPSLFHSQYAIRIVGWDDPISGFEILGAARVALGARKRLVLASVEGGAENLTGADAGSKAGLKEGGLVEGLVLNTTANTNAPSQDARVLIHSGRTAEGGGSSGFSDELEEARPLEESMIRDEPCEDLGSPMGVGSSGFSIQDAGSEYEASGFGAQGAEFQAQAQIEGSSGFRAPDSGLDDQTPGLGAQGAGSRVQSSGLKVVYTTIATDLEFVPLVARSQRPNRGNSATQRRPRKPKEETKALPAGGPSSAASAAKSDARDPGTRANSLAEGPLAAAPTPALE